MFNRLFGALAVAVGVGAVVAVKLLKDQKETEKKETEKKETEKQIDNYKKEKDEKREKQKIEDERIEKEISRMDKFNSNK